jgi:hypothetical protein
VSGNRQHMASIGRRGGVARHALRKAQSHVRARVPVNRERSGRGRRPPRSSRPESIPVPRLGRGDRSSMAPQSGASAHCICCVVRKIMDCKMSG